MIEKLKYDIIMITADEWGGLPRIRHRIAEHFSKNHRVIFIENPRLTYFSIFKDKKRVRRIMPIQRLKKMGNLYVYTPFLCFPFWQTSIILNKINNCFLRTNIKRVISSLNLQNVVIWFFYYNHSSIVGTLEELMSIYTVHDAWEEKKQTIQNITRKMEHSLISKVDTVFFTGIDNYKRKRRLNENSFYIPHGAPPVSAVTKSSWPIDLPKKGKILGYWGLVDNTSVDIQLMETISDHFPDDHIVLIGPFSKQFAKTIARIARHNIHLLGEKPRSQADKYLQFFDVGLIPYPRIPFRLRCSPLKIYDYLAYGLPVVSIDIHELETLKDYVYIATDNIDFVRNIRNCFKENPDLREKRRTYCSQNTWLHRLNKIEDIIDNNLRLSMARNKRCETEHSFTE